eukprot:CAMPEP_0115079850 /NCGR_PEP_ID=MMETSP0227-20121206/18340_1 /TAXON_ID=89957 /ORGANISM="Polarella glacialis, Strain CCMP 1383" /LENGTH=74 /DNA_ID=CAMNT_0002467405 /DNA_START=33 /DNA_END=253 /DNA_ORIENTATION=+
MTAPQGATSAFDAFDANHDGVLSRAEFAQMSHGAAPAQASYIPAPAPVTYAAQPSYAPAEPMMAPQHMTYAAPA